MSRALIVALTFGMATAVDVEWKGIFHTPDDHYTWGAQKVGGKYADDWMIIAAMPMSGHQQADLEGASSDGAALLNLASDSDQSACVEVTTGGLITPSDSACYKLVFDKTSDDTEYHVNATGVSAIAFFCQHFPTEFERDAHYFHDSTADIEPTYQDPVPSGGHDHGEGHWKDEFEGICVCQAAAHGWTLDCADQPHISAAVAALDADPNCMAEDPPQTCIDNFYIMQAHHDHCLHHDLPKGIEDKLHDYEQYYVSCFVKRQHDADLSACPTVDCTDEVGMADAVDVLEKGCDTNTTCGEKACADAIKKVLMSHDVCPQTSLPDRLESALHDHEEPCEAVLCNSVSGPFDPYDDKCAAEASGASGFGGLESFLVTTSALLFRVLN